MLEWAANRPDGELMELIPFVALDGERLCAAGS